MQYKIKSITWNGVWGHKTLTTAISGNIYLRFRYHGDYYYVRTGGSVPSGSILKFTSDRCLYCNSQGTMFSQQSYGAPQTSYQDIGDVTDDPVNNQYSSVNLHDLGQQNAVLDNIALSLGANEAGELTFTMHPSHDVYPTHEKNLIPMTSLIVVYEGSQILWQGRLTTKTENLDGSIECSAEGLLACANDGYINVYDNSSGVGVLPQTLVNYYTAQHYFSVARDSDGWGVSQPLPVNEKRVYPFKRWFSRGSLATLDSFGFVYRSDTEYSSMATLLKEAILDPLGGFFYLTYPDTAEKQPPALNYTTDISNIGVTKKVKFAVNLKDYQVEKDCSEFFTHLLPLGKLEEGVESYEGILSDGRFKLGWDGSWTRWNVSRGCIPLHTISPFSVAAEAIKNMGMVIKVVQFDDCTTQDGLYNAAVNYINSLNFDWTYSIDAVDMELIDSSQQPKPIHIGDTLQVFLPGNQSTTPDFSAVVLGINLNISEPWDSSYTIGNLNNKQVTRGLV